MQRPVILISPDFTQPGQEEQERTTLHLLYQQVIADAGGMPLAASPFADPDDLARLTDGWLITGGNDLPCEMYGSEPHTACKLMHPLRIEMESGLYRALSETGKPILGVCFGVQFLNVIAGGTLVPHLPDVLGSDRHTDGINRVRPEAGSRLSGLGPEREFNAACTHHQAVDRVAPGWRVAARAEDGTIEAIEEESGRWRFGVQWHPERTPDSPTTKALFQSFVRACSTRP
ncbi:MAG: gamma-glutamyl-gamma-aminobutyrate hydrolase family protein [Armatimonadetes bacterium]|nr:gamma-glutamyl-gamma-aminobutyrate hydrolase family protein [Armatimonadota bacterium]